VTPATDPEEIELKLTVLRAAAIRALILDPAAEMPGVELLGEARFVDHEDRYLDTSDRALRARGVIARVRTGPAGRRLTLKSLARAGTGAVHRRMELEGDAGDGDDPRDWPPSAARERLLEATGPAPLGVLVVLRQRRLQRDVAVGASVVELSLDEIEVVALDGSRRDWTDLEAELRSGSEEDLATIGDALLRRDDVEPARTSKLEHAIEVLDPAR
jgi:inorganic triphosphatase YgiF